VTATQTRIEPARTAGAGTRSRRPAGAGRLERRIFLVAVGVIALHVVDDSFLQPQPGTSAADHLVSGLAPLAVLGLAVGVGVAAAHAWSDGELDLLAAIEFLKRRPDVEPGRIGGLGLSVGGETFLQAAAHSEDVKAVVSEGATARSGGELRSVPGNGLGAIATNTVVTAGIAVFSNATPPPHLIDLVDGIAPRAMFLIYAPGVTAGEERRFNTAFYRAADEPKAIWGAPGAGHFGAQDARPREYEQRVTRFFDQALSKETR
jgi:uncharacterized protein